MKIIFAVSVILVLITASAPAGAQTLREIQIGGVYTLTPRLTDGQGLTAAKGPGFFSSMHFNLTSGMSVSLAGGYNSLAIEQDNAVEQWNWPFWERFYRNYTRSLVATDSNYVVNMTPVQHLYTIPVTINLNYFIVLKPYFEPFISMGGGMVFYERNLRLNEVWTKYFPETGGSFQYEYDNHAGSKSGNAFLVQGAIGFESRLSDFFGLSAGCAYTRYYTRQNDTDFPLKDNLGFTVGMVFYY